MRFRSVKSLKKRGDVAGLVGAARGAERDAAVAALGELGTDEAVQALTALADDPDFALWMRSEVVSVLGPKYVHTLRVARDIDGLIRTLSNRNHEVRAEATRALSELRDDPRTLPSLLAVLSARGSAKDAGTIAAAKDAVRTIGTVGRLIEIMKGGADFDARSGATVVLGLWKDPGAVDDLVALIADPQSDGALQITAVESLASIGDPRAIGPVASFVVKGLREFARMGGSPETLDVIVGSDFAALASFGSAAGPYLQVSRDGEQDQSVRILIDTVLRRIEKRPPAAATSPSRIAEIVGRWPSAPAGACDICSDQIAPEGSHRVPTAEFQSIVRKGYNPYTTGRMKGTETGILASTLGLSDEAAKEGWKVMALGTTTDFGLCRACAQDVALFIAG